MNNWYAQYYDFDAAAAKGSMLHGEYHDDQGNV